MAGRARVVWSAPALDDLDDIAAYIAADDEQAAARLVLRAFEAVERLRDFPASGRRRPELPNGPYREVIVRPCRIFYRPEATAIYIVHVTRGERPRRRRRLR